MGRSHSVYIQFQTYCKVECSCHMLLLYGDAKNAGLCRRRGRRVWCVGSHDGFNSPRGYSQRESTSDVSRSLENDCRDSSRFVQLQHIRAGRHSCIVANRVGCARACSNRDTAQPVLVARQIRPVRQFWAPTRRHVNAAVA